MLLKKLFFCLFLIILFSCSTKEINYINYYNTAYDIDSIYRYKKDTLTALKLYKKLFEKFPPKNNEKMEEYETYIKLSDRQHKNFGGKKSLYKLIPLVAPYWKYKRQESSFFELYKKYGIDSIEAEQKVDVWKKQLNKQLIDSFTIAFVRDQKVRNTEVLNMDSLKKYDEMNKRLLFWTFKNFGYPSMQKIGLIGNDDVMISLGTILNHMANVREYPYLKVKLLDYVKSGELPPRDYMEMVDRHNSTVDSLGSEYGIFEKFNEVIDTSRIDRNRKLIGFPGLKHWGRITKDFWKNQRKNK